MLSCEIIDGFERFAARRVVWCGAQGFELRSQCFGYRYFPLGQGMSVGRFDGAIGDAHHVQHHIVVVFVDFMAVSVPISDRSWISTLPTHSCPPILILALKNRGRHRGCAVPCR